jgi:hypothetical protein
MEDEEEHLRILLEEADIDLASASDADDSRAALENATSKTRVLLEQKFAHFRTLCHHNIVSEKLDDVELTFIFVEVESNAC